MSEESWIKEVLLGIFGGLAALSSLLAGRLWVVQDARISAVEEQQKADRKTCGEDLTQHSVADASQHDVIRKNLAEEISRLHGKIDDTRKNLAEEISRLHGKIDDTRREIKSDLATIVTLIQRDR